MWFEIEAPHFLVPSVPHGYSSLYFKSLDSPIDYSSFEGLLEKIFHKQDSRLRVFLFLSISNFIVPSLLIDEKACHFFFWGQSFPREKLCFMTLMFEAAFAGIWFNLCFIISGQSFSRSKLCFTTLMFEAGFAGIWFDFEGLLEKIFQKQDVARTVFHFQSINQLIFILRIGPCPFIFVWWFEGVLS